MKDGYAYFQITQIDAIHFSADRAGVMGLFTTLAFVLGPFFIFVGVARYPGLELEGIYDVVGAGGGRLPRGAESVLFSGAGAIDFYRLDHAVYGRSAVRRGTGEEDVGPDSVVPDFRFPFNAIQDRCAIDLLHLYSDLGDSGAFDMSGWWRDFTERYFQDLSCLSERIGRIGRAGAFLFDVVGAHRQRQYPDCDCPVSVVRGRTLSWDVVVYAERFPYRNADVQGYVVYAFNQPWIVIAQSIPDDE